MRRCLSGASLVLLSSLFGAWLALSPSVARPADLSHPVLAYYYAWWDPENFSRTLFQPPAPYNSDDGGVMQRHIQQAKSGGIDGFIVAWYGNGDRTDSNLAKLLDMGQRSGFSATSAARSTQTIVRSGSPMATTSTFSAASHGTALAHTPSPGQVTPRPSCRAGPMLRARSRLTSSGIRSSRRAAMTRPRVRPPAFRIAQAAAITRRRGMVPWPPARRGPSWSVRSTNGWSRRRSSPASNGETSTCK